jgi:hypothetical protein
MLKVWKSVSFQTEIYKTFNHPPETKEKTHTLLYMYDQFQVNKNVRNPQQFITQM